MSADTSASRTGCPGPWWWVLGPIGRAARLLPHLLYRFPTKHTATMTHGLGTLDELSRSSMNGPGGSHHSDSAPYADVHETHVGVVFLVGDRAYKIKKPVRTGFLDFSTAARRKAACRRELELNRRLSPDVYLGLAEVSDPLGGESEAAVVMRRMPGRRRLSELVRRGEPVAGQLRMLARRLSAFHATAERGPAISAQGSRDALRGRWTDSFTELARFRGGVLDDAVAADIELLALRFLARRAPLFDRRIAQRRVLDGHGDLIADDVFCLADGPRALDCLEFDDALRYVDGLDDACFLAMDLDRLGHPELAERFLADYADFAGDPAPAALTHHYTGYRALIRAKVACLRHEQGDPTAADDVRRYCAVALRHLEQGAVRLVLVGGLPGTGKSTLAAALADRFGAVLLSSDRVRKELAGLDPLAPARSSYRSRLYRPRFTAQVYAELRRRAGALLALGESVVLDTSWTDERERDAAEQLAVRESAELVRIRCHAPPTLVEARLGNRGPTASDADLAVSAAMADDADPWPDAVVVRTDVPLAQSCAAAENVWRQSGTAARGGD